jgi:hypothetical protein
MDRIFLGNCTICGKPRDWQLDEHPQAVCHACAHPLWYRPQSVRPDPCPPRCTMTKCVLPEGHDGACARAHYAGCELDKDHIGPCLRVGLTKSISSGYIHTFYNLDTPTAAASAPPDPITAQLRAALNMRTRQRDCTRGMSTSPDWCMTHERSLWNCVEALRAERDKWDEAENALGVAYLKLRSILNAFDTPHAPTREQVWKHTEECARSLLESAAWAKMHVCKPPLGNPTREEAIDALLQIHKLVADYKYISMRTLQDAHRLGRAEERLAEIDSVVQDRIRV